MSREDRHRQLLRKNQVQLMQQLDATELLFHLICLTNQSKEGIEAEHRNHGRTRGMMRLLDDLPRYDGWHKQLIDALHHPSINQPRLAHLLTPYSALQQCTCMNHGDLLATNIATYQDTNITKPTLRATSSSEYQNFTMTRVVSPATHGTRHQNIGMDHGTNNPLTLSTVTHQGTIMAHGTSQTRFRDTSLYGVDDIVHGNIQATPDTAYQDTSIVKEKNNLMQGVQLNDHLRKLPSKVLGILTVLDYQNEWTDMAAELGMTIQDEKDILCHPELDSCTRKLISKWCYSSDCTLANLIKVLKSMKRFDILEDLSRIKGFEHINFPTNSCGKLSNNLLDKSVPTSDNLTSEPTTIFNNTSDKHAMVSNNPSAKPVMVSDDQSIKPFIISDDPSFKPVMILDDPSAKPVMISDDPSTKPTMISDDPLEKSVMISGVSAKPLMKLDSQLDNSTIKSAVLSNSSSFKPIIQLGSKIVAEHDNSEITQPDPPNISSKSQQSDRVFDDENKEMASLYIENTEYLNKIEVNSMHCQWTVTGKTPTALEQRQDNYCDVISDKLVPQSPDQNFPTVPRTVSVCTNK